MVQHKPIEYFLGLSYPIVIERDPEGGFVAKIKELPGCVTQADSEAEIFSMIEDAKRNWIEVAYEHGDDIPEPRAEESFSGRLLVRLPRSLHRELAEDADAEGVSLNQHIVRLLAERRGMQAITYRFDRFEKIVSEHVQESRQSAGGWQMNAPHYATYGFSPDDDERAAG